MKWIIGKKIDNYLITRIIGKGGMGVVLEAIDKNLDMTVALKLMKPMLAEDKTFIRRFKTEARALAKLQSPNIVRVLALRESEYGLFIVMEFVKGITVADQIYHSGKLPWSNVKPVICQLLKAIGHAHSAGVLHLDLKPRNIMLTDDNVVKVTDFGLAKVQKDSTYTTNTSFNAGTLSYMSPEQLRGRGNVDERSDIYSIGITMYEMLTGKTPFDRTQSEFDLQENILKGNIPSIKKTNPGLPEDLGRLVMKAIKRNPAKRFQNTESMLHAIDAVEITEQSEHTATSGHSQTLPYQPRDKHIDWDEAHVVGGENVFQDTDSETSQGIFRPDVGEYGKQKHHEETGADDESDPAATYVPPAAPGQHTINIVKPFRLPTPFIPVQTFSSDRLNPYQYETKIEDISAFYGRKNEINKVFSRIGASRPQSISLMGNRRIGKSSLLNSITHPANRLRFLHNPEEYVFVYIDFREQGKLDIAGFIKAIYNRLLKEFEGNLELHIPPNYDGLKQLTEVMDGKSYKLIMVFDEFENITRNNNFDTEFYAFFRSLANNHNVSFLVASEGNLQTLCHSREISNSPFFNIFSNINLGPLNSKEAQDLITQPAEKSGLSMNSYIPLIIDLAGYHPFFIQMACRIVFQYLKRKKNELKAPYRKIRIEFAQKAAKYFLEIWEDCEEDKRNVLSDLTENKVVPASDEFHLKSLLKDGYVRTENKKPVVFSSIFAQYILQNKTPAFSKKKKNRLWPFKKRSY